MRAAALLLASIVVPGGIAAQQAPPVGLEALEMDRSRACVGILNRLADLDAGLQPLAARSQRLRVIGQAIALEERSVVDSLRVDDPTEAAVRAWFEADLALAQQFVDTRDEAIHGQRSAAREQIMATLNAALADLQGQAQAQIDASGDLAAAAAPCDGAILVRTAVTEMCQTESGPVCDDVAATEPGGRYRFVDTADDLWDVAEFRPWTNPGPLQITPEGEIRGARTVGYARQGNVVVTLSFGPLLQERASLDEDQIARLESIVDSLGFEFSHPTIVFAPSLGMRATLPQPVAGETFYVLHLGEPEEAEVLWTGPAGTGAVIDVTIAVGPNHATMLASGLPISFTGVQEVEGGDNEAVFSIQVTPVNQTQAVRALMGYMSGQLSLDLATFVPPGSEDRPPR